MIIPVRQMTPEGVAQFQEWLANGAAGHVPRHIIYSDDCSKLMSPEVSIDTDKKFTNRLLMALYLQSKLVPYKIATPDYAHGVWTWLSAAYFETLAPRGKDGERIHFSKEADFPAYIWKPNASGFGRKFYRHRVGFAVKILEVLGRDEAIPLLDSEPGVLSSYCEENYARVGGGIEFTLSIKLANSLFWNGHNLKSGWKKNIPGGLIHMHRWISQLSVNYDVTKMTLTELRKKLPPELSR